MVDIKAGFDLNDSDRKEFGQDLIRVSLVGAEILEVRGSDMYAYRCDYLSGAQTDSTCAKAFGASGHGPYILSSPAAVCGRPNQSSRQIMYPDYIHQQRYYLPTFVYSAISSI